MIVRPYQPPDHERLVAFLRTSWSPRHALYDPTLFDWQYRTDGNGRSLIAEDENRIVGFFGAFASAFVIDGRERPGTTFALWVVAEEHRRSGLGAMLLTESMSGGDAFLTLGCNSVARSIYERLGFSYFPALNRYVVPLEPEGYATLLGAGAPKSDSLRAWCGTVRTRSVAAASPARPDLNALTLLYQKSVAPVFRFAVQRRADYWRWRYVENVGFRYLLFGDPASTGLVVARLEETRAEGSSANGMRTLRIIEAIPADAGVWNGGDSGRFVDLLSSVLVWAAAEGCAAADFQCSHRRLDRLLTGLGFRNQEGSKDPMVAALPRIFRPLKRDAGPINAAWKIAGVGHVSSDDLYLVKSDGDMDRPILWPESEPPAASAPHG